MLSLVAAEFMSPGAELFRLGPVSLRWYGLLIAIAVVLGTFLAQRLAERRGLTADVISDLAIWLIVGAVPCARLYYVAFAWHERYQGQPWTKAFAIWEGGIAIHGAILGGAIAAWIFARRRQISVWLLADVVMPSLVLGQAIGRWGNFFNSEAFGTPTDLPWKLYIPPERRPPGLEGAQYFHPTFLYESLWNLVVLSVLITLFNRFPQARSGTLVMIYAIGYSVGRFWIEGLRTDSLMVGTSLRIAQAVSLGAIALGTLGLIWLYGLRRSLPDTAGQP